MPTKLQAGIENDGPRRFGLFGQIQDATIKNVSVLGTITHLVNPTETSIVGAVVGEAIDSTIGADVVKTEVDDEEVREYFGVTSYVTFADLTIEGNLTLGGIVGRFIRGFGAVPVIKYPIQYGHMMDISVTGVGRIGGIVGETEHVLLTHFVNFGRIERINGSNVIIGGLVGYANMYLDCYYMVNYGNISVGHVHSVGGLIGRAAEGEIANSYNRGRIEAQSIREIGGLGGIVGVVGGDVLVTDGFEYRVVYNFGYIATHLERHRQILGHWAPADSGWFFARDVYGIDILLFGRHDRLNPDSTNLGVVHPLTGDITQMVTGTAPAAPDNHLLQAMTDAVMHVANFDVWAQIFPGDPFNNDEWLEAPWPPAPIVPTFQFVIDAYPYMQVVFDVMGGSPEVDDQWIYVFTGRIDPPTMDIAKVGYLFVGWAHEDDVAVINALGDLNDVENIYEIEGLVTDWGFPVLDWDRPIMGYTRFVAIYMIHWQNIKFDLHGGSWPVLTDWPPARLNMETNILRVQDTLETLAMALDGHAPAPTPIWGQIVFLRWSAIGPGGAQFTGWHDPVIGGHDDILFTIHAVWDLIVILNRGSVLFALDDIVDELVIHRPSGDPMMVDLINGEFAAGRPFNPQNATLKQGIRFLGWAESQLQADRGIVTIRGREDGDGAILPAVVRPWELFAVWGWVQPFQLFLHFGNYPSSGDIGEHNFPAAGVMEHIKTLEWINVNSELTGNVLDEVGDRWYRLALDITRPTDFMFYDFRVPSPTGFFVVEWLRYVHDDGGHLLRIDRFDGIIGMLEITGQLAAENRHMLNLWSVWGNPNTEIEPIIPPT
jgi:hypothetical protein